MRAVSVAELSAADATRLGVVLAECHAALHYVTSNGRVLSGAAACNVLLRRVPVLGPLLGALERSRPLLAIESRCYRYVAAHRRALSRALRMTACRVR